jgi:release factor glutamine methyltransferase
MENKTISVGSILKIFREELKNDYDEKEIKKFLYMLFDEWKGWNRANILLHHEELFSKEEVTRFYLTLEELKRHKPIQYIIGTAYFHDLKLVVTPAVLIPRPETEELVDIIIRENASKKHEEFSILDIGTGSGCIALSLKKNFPHSAVFALDNSIDALQVAIENADRNGCQIRFFHQDIFQKAEQFVFPEYDIIISNPPYISESEKKEVHKNVLDYEPNDALFVPDNDPLIYYRAIADFAMVHLSRPGLLYLEINERFGPEIRTLLSINGFDKVEVIKDINGKDRFIRAEANNPLTPSVSLH